MKKFIGKTTISPLIFYSGKISGYVAWALLFISLFSITDTSQLNPQRWGAVIILCLGLMFTIFSLINLGKSTRLGIPQESTEFKTNGLYKISKNPMYLGFSLLSLSAILFTNNFIVIFLGVYSICVYHLIILGEGKFLESRFSEKYLEYKKNVRRYL
jgi:protein-S-isoprenylcysteine O-methyltransferase Ste14